MDSSRKHDLLEGNGNTGARVSGRDISGQMMSRARDQESSAGAAWRTAERQIRNW